MLKQLCIIWLKINMTEFFLYNTWFATNDSCNVAISINHNEEAA